MPTAGQGELDETTVRARLRAAHERIERACRACGREPSSVRLLLATKTVPASVIALAVRAGSTLLGENKVQEGLSKHEEVERLAGVRPSWHFIGHLQTNKVPEVLRFAQVIQSVDRSELARKLHARLEREGRSIDVLIQVNTSGEASKHGCAPGQAPALVREIAAMGTMRVMGLMTIGLLGATPGEARPGLRRLREIRDRVRDEAIPGVSMDVLSMGMSGDLEVAIEEGSTLVRLGTAVFGPRA